MSIDLFVAAVVDRLDDNDILAAPWETVPATAGWQGAPGQSTFNPYVMVTRLGSADQRGFSFDDEFTDFRPDLFCRYFAGTHQQAETLAADARAVLLGRQVTVPGFSTLRMWVYNSQTTTKNDNTETSLYEAGDFFRLWVAPEGES